jgi:hypothetical protein
MTVYVTSCRQHDARKNLIYQEMRVGRSVAPVKVEKLGRARNEEQRPSSTPAILLPVDSASTYVTSTHSQSACLSYMGASNG